MENPNLIFGIYMILYFLSRMTLIAMFGVYITKSTQVSEMVEGLSRMKVPGYIRIPFSVLLRFAPTMRHEIRALQENMKIRGVVSGRWFLLRHPIKYAEYTLIPLLMRAIKIADELSASALIRGLDSKDKRISPVDLNPKMMDALFSVAGVLIVLGTVILQNYM
jgi:energy-coupling factor transporter transmembrane protein EcfT